MNETLTHKFGVKNLDCPSCAAKIEKGLKAVDGVQDAILDFAGLTLHVKSKDISGIVEEVRKIVPEVELVPKAKEMQNNDDNKDPAPYSVKKELAILFFATLLFMFHLFWGEGFSKRPFGELEILAVLAAYLLAGWNVIAGALKTIRRGVFFDENVLMVIATVGAMAIHAYAEAVAVMIFYKIGELLQEMAVSRSRRSIKGLLAARPDKAVVKTPEGYMEVLPEMVEVGETILIKPGEKVPLDGMILTGTSLMDSSVLTGESVPVSVQPEDSVMAGQINKTGALTARVSRPFVESSISKVMELVENATARKAKTEKFITTLARYYTPAVVFFACCIAFVPPLMVNDASFKAWIYRALVLLVISCPCALVVSIPLGYFGGIGNASRKGILVKGSNYIDALSAVDTVVFDKTGTLTKGVFKVKEVVSVNGYSKLQVLEFAAAAEYQSNHPIAESILSAFSSEGRELEIDRISDHIDMAGKGVSARYGDHTVLVGNDSLLHLKDVHHEKCDFGTTVAHVVVDGIQAGYVTIGDEIRPDAEKTIAALREQKVNHIAMLTGDNVCTAEAVSKKLGIDSFHAGLFPEDKVKIFEEISERKNPRKKIAFVGDGINDAPVIARADVGVAMGALGSDAAIETADVVLMTDSPFKMAEAVSIAKQTRRIVWQNIGLVFLIKGVFIFLGSLGIATMWEAVFADMGTALLAVANATRILGKN
jgi:Cd2+/Zn2+-exporting ATPase